MFIFEVTKYVTSKLQSMLLLEVTKYVTFRSYEYVTFRSYKVCYF